MNIFSRRGALDFNNTHPFFGSRSRSSWSTINSNTCCRKWAKRRRSRAPAHRPWLRYRCGWIWHRSRSRRFLGEIYTWRVWNLLITKYHTHLMQCIDYVVLQCIARNTMVDVGLTTENGNWPERLRSLADVFAKWARALIRHEYDWGGSKINTTPCHSSSHFWTASLALQRLHYKIFPCSPPSFWSPPRSSWFPMPGTVDTPNPSQMCGSLSCQRQDDPIKIHS